MRGGLARGCGAHQRATFEVWRVEPLLQLWLGRLSRCSLHGPCIFRLCRVPPLPARVAPCSGMAHYSRGQSQRRSKSEMRKANPGPQKTKATNGAVSICPTETEVTCTMVGRPAPPASPRLSLRAAASGRLTRTTAVQPGPRLARSVPSAVVAAVKAFELSRQPTGRHKGWPTVARHVETGWWRAVGRMTRLAA